MPSLKRPRLVKNASRVLKHSSTLRLIELSFVIMVLDLGASILPALDDFLPFNPVWLTAAGSLCMSAAWGARFIAQSKMRVNDGQ